MRAAVSAAGSALSRYAVRAAMGSPRRRALDGVYRRAIERTVEKVSADEEITDLDLVHAVGLLETMVSAAAEEDLPLLESEKTDDETMMRRWREIAEEQGLDTETFPLPFEKLVDQLLRCIADEALHTAVDGDGNRLFPAVAAEHLVDLRRSMRTMARTIGPDGQVGAALQAAYRACQDRNRALFTPDVLLAILHLHDNSVTDCFEAVQSGLALSIAHSLRRFQDTPVAAFCPFEWVERAEMRQAQIHAWAHNAPAVNGPLLLLGILDTPSTTRDALANRLGQDIEVLRYAATSRIGATVQHRTPGILFEDT
ncbi:hypothetical protein [Nocardia alni]|uniref:hypothetical protein n=1 Tax=Nocardia alni TaxID=2815723 RepID=UPI001C250725|nr:hypothetical protein [Nocardia alni]